MRRSLAMALAMLAGVPGSVWGAAVPTTQPSATVMIGDQQFSATMNTRDEGKTWFIGDIETGQRFETAEGTVQLTGLFNTDPFINYGLVVTDIGAPSVFGFVFGTPIVPTGSPNVVTGSIVGGLTDATGDGVTLTPVGGPLAQVSSVGFPATGMGVDVGPGVSGGPGPAGSLYGYGPFSSGSIPGPGPGPWTFMTVGTTFSLSGGGDIAALTGTGIIVIPEPVIGVAAAGMMMVLVGRRRR